MIMQDHDYVFFSMAVVIRGPISWDAIEYLLIICLHFYWLSEADKESPPSCLGCLCDVAVCFVILLKIDQ